MSAHERDKCFRKAEQKALKPINALSVRDCLVTEVRTSLRFMGSADA